MHVFCALVSGGKDSILSAKLCRELGHKLRCLGNLRPKAGDETDSWVYQTVGHQWLPKLADSMQLPLVRRDVLGAPVATESLSYYAAVTGDETEDLFILLEEVKRQYPDITAVSVGAILSDFQRLRVENVCSRIGLVVLAPLWQMSQPAVLDLLEKAEIDARIIKVATLGLDETHLGKSLVELRSHLRKISVKFGVHEAGEGGEFESFVFAAPGLMRHHLEIVNTDIVKHAAEVWYLTGSVDLGLVDDREEKMVFDSVRDLSFYNTAEFEPKLRYTDEDETCAVEYSNSFDMSSLDLVELFGKVGVAKETILFVEVQVSDISLFALVNQQYSSIFTSEPPARVTIQSALPDGVMCRIRVVYSPSKFRRLHVQSISTWAMACIGPYAQSVTAGSTCLTSGVLGLIPHSMTLPPGGWEAELILALRSLCNVVDVAGPLADTRKVAIVHVTPSAGSLIEVEERVKQYLPTFQVLVVRVPALPRGACIEVNYLLGIPADIVSQLDSTCQRFHHVFYDVNKVTDEHFSKLCRYASTPCIEVSGPDGLVAVVY